MRFGDVELAVKLNYADLCHGAVQDKNIDHITKLLTSILRVLQLDISTKDMTY